MFEQQLEKGLFSNPQEKTFIDKILAKEDVASIREIIKKPRLDRSDILELLYMIIGTESKLVNLGEWDRYVALKFFVWIREFVKVAELLFDYQDDLKIQQDAGKLKLNNRTMKLIKNNERLIQHNAKFLIDLYLNIIRTTLSLGGTGFLEVLKNKYEVAYSGLAGQPPVMQEKKSGLLGWGKK